MPPPSDERLAGRAIGHGRRLVLRRLLGEGAGGAIWLADDTKRERQVAVKLLHPGSLSNATAQARFVREGRRFGRIRHPNLVRVYGLGYEGRVPFIVTEFVDGRTLLDLLEEGAFEPEQALAVARDVADGLGAAHDRGVVHRDLKPANIMIRSGDGTAKVLDFGIAKDLRSDTAITRIGAYVGTPAYSAPEQILGEDVDHRTDVYALGVIFYELLTGPLSLDGRQTTELFRAAVNERNIPLGELHARVSRPLALLIQRMTRRHKDRRPASMQEVAGECARLVTVLGGRAARGEVTSVRSVLRDLFES